MKTKKIVLCALLISAIAAGTVSYARSLQNDDMAATGISFTGNTCAVATYDHNSDGYIYKGTITLTRVVSGKQERFYLFNKGGVDYVSTSKRGPYYRLAHRMTINNIDYKY